MATINKDFKIKNGLIVEGSTATVNGNDILTKSAADTTYIQGLVGGVANSEAVANAIVLRDANASFAANVVTVNTVNLGTAGSIADDDGDLVIDLTVNGDDFIVNADDIRLNTGDDVILNATGSVSITGTSDITLQSENVYVGTNLNFVDSERVASRGYVDGAISNIDLTFNSDEITEGTTNLYITEGRVRGALIGIGGISYDTAKGEISVDRTTVDPWYDAAGSADTAQTNAQNYANGLIDDTGISMTSVWSSFNTSSNIDTAQTNAVTIANAYTDDAVANLVNGAPELLDTLNELAAALDDNPNVIADLQDIAAGKQDALTAGTGIDIVGNTISVRAGAYDAYGSADTAQTNAVTIANAYTDTEIDALTTDDIEEGTSNKYFTAQRSVDATVGGDGVGQNATYLTTAAQFGVPFVDVNISALETQLDSDGYAKTEDIPTKQELVIGSPYLTTEEDMLAGTVLTLRMDQVESTLVTDGFAQTEDLPTSTDDLAQGTTNLYFSNALAVSALEAVTPNFQSVDITWVRREEATWTDANTAGTHTAHTFGTSEGSVKYLVRIFNNGDSQVSEVLVTTDSSNNIAVLEYGTIYTSANPLATVTADWDSGSSEYRLRVTTANNNSEILVAATLVAYND